MAIKQIKVSFFEVAKSSFSVSILPVSISSIFIIASF